MTAREFRDGAKEILERYAALTPFQVSEIVGRITAHAVKYKFEKDNRIIGRLTS